MPSFTRPFLAFVLGGAGPRDYVYTCISTHSYMYTQLANSAPKIAHLMIIDSDRVLRGWESFFFFLMSSPAFERSQQTSWNSKEYVMSLIM